MRPLCETFCLIRIPVFQKQAKRTFSEIANQWNISRNNKTFYNTHIKWRSNLIKFLYGPPSPLRPVLLRHSFPFTPSVPFTVLCPIYETCCFSMFREMVLLFCCFLKLVLTKRANSRNSKKAKGPLLFREIAKRVSRHRFVKYLADCSSNRVINPLTSVTTSLNRFVETCKESI